MIKKIYFSAVLFFCVSLTFSQNGLIKNIGNTLNFAQQINDVFVATTNTAVFVLPTPSGNSIIGKVNLKTSVDGFLKIVGNGSDATSTLSLSVHANGDIDGLYTSIKDRKAFRYYTDEITNDLMVKEVNIESVICIDYKEAPVGKFQNKVAQSTTLSAIPLFESKPGSQFVIYIDLDGEVSTSDWNGGTTINAAARAWASTDVQTIWEIVAQDYLIYDVNVTTDRTVFNAASTTKKKMCIVTSTNTAAPGSGGVAYISSFDDGKGNPCWAFNSGAKTAGETISHEVGHTMGLHHDGDATNTYYMGHADWAPIMGASYTKAIGHWSLGEYSGANMQEDDINIIGTTNGFSLKADDAGNTTATAKALTVEANGAVLDVLNRGLINNRADLDIYKFTTLNAGNINLSIKPFYKYPNLNIKARLLNSSGIEVVNSDSPTVMSATITATNLPAGTYYLEVDGVGNGANASVGYSDYSSIGDYYITGTVPLPSNKPVVDFATNSLKFCAGTQITYTDASMNGVIAWSWSFPGGSPASSTAQNPTVTYSTSGSYNVKLVVKNSFGIDSLVKTNYVQVSNAPLAPTTIDDIRCSSGVVNLVANGSGGTLEWYDAPTGGTLVNAGTAYAPNLNTSTTYYVSETNASNAQKVGAVDKSLNTGGYFTASDTRGLLFDVISSCTLKTVRVFANTAGNRTIEVRQGVGGTVLFTKSVNVPVGDNRVTLDFNLQPGTQYHIKVTGTLIDLYRNTGGASYPYALSGLINITETDAAPANPNYYYYFYDWEVTVAGCSSTRAPVTGIISTTPPKPTITQIGTVLTSSASSGNQWYLNGTAIPGATNQTYNVLTYGTYTVVATQGTCASAASTGLTVNNVGIAEAADDTYFTIFPNPTDGNLNITFNATIKASYKLEIKNTLGQLVYKDSQIDFNGNYSKQLNVAEYGKGVYLLSLTPLVSDNKKEIVKKIVVY